MTNINIDDNNPLYTLSVGQFVELLRKTLVQPQQNFHKEQAIGLAALARALSCSTSQISKLRRDGVLDGAILSHIGRRIVFDIEKAREAANKWYAQKSNRQ